MYHGGGLPLLREFFANYHIVNFPAGNTGTQMGGWFRREIKSLGDLKGIKMRIPGIGGEIMSKLGVIPQTLAGGDIYPALEKGTIDATEWVGPHDDEKLGFYKIVKNYYYPGWWEPQAQVSIYVNDKEWAKLPKVYQEIVAAAAADANVNMMAEYDYKNPRALIKLLEHGVKLRSFPTDMMKAAYKAAFELYEDEAGKNPAFKKLYTGWKKFRGPTQGWFTLAESTMENFMYSAGAPK
jgi:TRAP-type mannitol/chloroaromatic compound transport system substrate-binding protein